MFQKTSQKGLCILIKLLKYNKSNKIILNPFATHYTNLYFILKFENNSVCLLHFQTESLHTFQQNFTWGHFGS